MLSTKAFIIPRVPPHFLKPFPNGEYDSNFEGAGGGSYISLGYHWRSANRSRHQDSVASSTTPSNTHKLHSVTTSLLAHPSKTIPAPSILISMYKRTAARAQLWGLGLFQGCLGLRRVERYMISKEKKRFRERHVQDK